MTRKGIYYCRINSHDPVNKGAVQKCHGLMEGFRSLGWDMDIVWYSEAGILVNDQVVFRFPFATTTEAWRNVLFNHLLFDQQVLKTVNFAQYELFFVRYPLSHPGFLRLLRKAKLTNPALKILLEIPTYPYHLEHSGIARRLQMGVDKLCSRYLKNWVDKTVHYGQFEHIFGIPSIALRNGVEVSAIPVSKAISQPGVLRLLAVGNWNFWHGLDRLLTGLAEYYNTGDPSIKIELTIIGEGRELFNYKSFVRKNSIENSVRFMPPIDGVALDCLFDKADICIGCLGIFRKNVKLDSSLKHRNYCARGLPFILTTTDPDFPKELPWVLYFAENESPISLDNLILFHTALCVRQDVRSEIRRYAEDNLDWSNKLKNIPALNF